MCNTLSALQCYTYKVLANKLRFLVLCIMPRSATHATPSHSIPRQLHDRFRQRLPGYGDRSRVVTRLIELWLDRKLPPLDLRLRSPNVGNG